MSHLTDLQSTLAALDTRQLDTLATFVRDCRGTLWLAGNGGSAAIAQHWACDLSKAAGRRVLSLGCNPALLTAWANDEHYSGALSHELAGAAGPNDALICLSCSGTSPNILHLLRHTPLPRAIVTGPVWRGTVPLAAVVTVPSESYGVIEDCFSAIGHWLTEELRG